MSITPPDALPTVPPKAPCRCGGRIDFCCPQTQPFDAVRDELRAAGYTPHHDNLDAQMIASRLWFRCLCRRRLSYVGFGRPGSYRAFAVCSRCGHWWEC